MIILFLFAFKYMQLIACITETGSESRLVSKFTSIDKLQQAY
jgi:hypothetical protein